MSSVGTLQAQPATRATLTVEELAQMLGLSLRSTYNALMRGEIPHRKVGSRYVIGKEAIEDWLGVVPTPVRKEDFLVRVDHSAHTARG